MKTSKLLGLLIAFIMLISVSSCGPTYYNSRPRGYAGRRHYSPPRPAHGLTVAIMDMVAPAGNRR